MSYREQDAVEERFALLDAAGWQAIEADSDFRKLVAAKLRFIIPATLFFIAYYFALPVLVGYFPALMEVEVIGRINLAYLFALSQFFVAWFLAYLYVRRAAALDVIAARIRRRGQIVA